MAFSFQYVTMGGHIASAPQVFTYGKEGKLLVKFAMAMSDYSSGKPLFLNCAGFNSIATYLGKNACKGDRLVANGVLRPSSWVDKKTGESRNSMEFIINSAWLVDKAGARKSNETDRPPFGEGDTDNQIGGAPHRDDFRAAQNNGNAADEMLNDAPF